MEINHAINQGSTHDHKICVGNAQDAAWSRLFYRLPLSFRHIYVPQRTAPNLRLLAATRGYRLNESGERGRRIPLYPWLAKQWATEWSLTEWGLAVQSLSLFEYPLTYPLEPEESSNAHPERILPEIKIENDHVSRQKQTWLDNQIPQPQLDATTNTWPQRIKGPTFSRVIVIGNYTYSKAAFQSQTDPTLFFHMMFFYTPLIKSAHIVPIHRRDRRRVHSINECFNPDRHIESRPLLIWLVEERRNEVDRPTPSEHFFDGCGKFH